MNIDEFIERAQESAKKHRYHADFFDINNPMRTVCIKSAEDCEQLAEWLEKSKEYQHLEEQDRLVKLPCKVGDTVYAIGFDNKPIIYESVILSILITEKEIVFNVKVDEFGINSQLKQSMFGRTVFLTEPEARAKLKELRCNND